MYLKKFGFKRCDSVTQILFDLRLPSFDTLLHNSRVVFFRALCIVVLCRRKHKRKQHDYCATEYHDCATWNWFNTRDHCCWRQSNLCK